MRASPCLTAAILIAASPLSAEETEVPDAGFLEYLGMWDGQDEDWTLFEEELVEAGAETEDDRDGPAPKGEAPTELDDES